MHAMLPKTLAPPTPGSVRYVSRRRRDAYGRWVWVVVREELMWREVGIEDGPFIDREEAQAFADAFAVEGASWTLTRASGRWSP